MPVNHGLEVMEGEGLENRRGRGPRRDGRKAAAPLARTRIAHQIGVGRGNPGPRPSSRKRHEQGRVAPVDGDRLSSDRDLIHPEDRPPLGTNGKSFAGNCAHYTSIGVPPPRRRAEASNRRGCARSPAGWARGAGFSSPSRRPGGDVRASPAGDVDDDRGSPYPTVSFMLAARTMRCLTEVLDLEEIHGLKERADPPAPGCKADSPASRRAASGPELSR